MKPSDLPERAILSCPLCGGSIIGDGITFALHCENANEEDYYYKEPDAPITLCTFKEEKEDPK